MPATTGCGRAQSQDDAQVDAAEVESETAAEVGALGRRISFETNDVAVSVPVPAGWESYRTDFGVVLAEYIGSIATEGELGGLLAHVFVPQLDFSLSASAGGNLAWDFLSQIVADHDYVGGATVSELHDFIWSGHDAAYYLVDNGDGHPSIVIGVGVPDRNQIVTLHISAPVGQVRRIRESLPTLLNGMTVNGRQLLGPELDSLPNPLLFPLHGD